MASASETQQPLDSICPYFTRFPLTFPLSLLEKVSAKKVFDPFCGSGATLLAARLAGRQAYGMDSSPLATVISRAKLSYLSPQTLTGHAEAILSRPVISMKPPSGEFWNLCFTPSLMQQLLQFRAHFTEALHTDLDVTLCAVVAGMLHGPFDNASGIYLSNDMPASFSPPPDFLTDYWTRKGTRPPDIDILNVIEQRVNVLYGNCPCLVPGQVKLADCRCADAYAPFADVDYIITSPPYFGMDRYFPNQWLRLWLMGKETTPPDSITQDNAEHYIRDLARVWKNCSEISRNGTIMVVRLGNTWEGHYTDPIGLLTSSLEQSGTRWILDGYERVTKMITTPSSEFPFPLPSRRPPVEYNFHIHLEV